MVERWAAEAYFVVEIPNTLKDAIEQIIPQYKAMIHPFAAIWWKAYALSSKRPKLQRLKSH